jgi:hypothetical protein
MPTLPNVPRQPRGDVNSPCVLICAGGVPGVKAVVAVVIIVNHGWSERTVVRKDCRLVWGITSNVHCIGPLLGGGGAGSPGLT